MVKVKLVAKNARIVGGFCENVCGMLVVRTAV